MWSAENDKAIWLFAGGIRSEQEFEIVPPVFEEAKVEKLYGEILLSVKVPLESRERIWIPED